MIASGIYSFPILSFIRPAYLIPLPSLNAFPAFWATEHISIYYAPMNGLPLNGRYVAYESWGISKSSDGKNAQ